MAQDDTSGGSRLEVGVSFGHLGRLSSWVAHELNNSLGGIHNSFALLQRLIPPDHPHFRYVAAVEREIARSTALSRRLQHGYAFDSERGLALPLTPALARIVSSLAPLAEARGVTIAVEAGPGSKLEPTCALVAQAAVRHLLQHAIEFSAEGEIVRVRSSFEDEMCCLTVSYRNATAPPGRGPFGGPPGLALALVQDLILSLDGALLHDQSDGQEGELRLTLRPHATEASAACQ